MFAVGAARANRLTSLSLPPHRVQPDRISPGGRKDLASSVANPAMNARRTTPQGGAPVSPVVDWRRSQLVLAGFDAAVATELAEDCGIDLHALLELTDRGCPPHLAARILAPLAGHGRPC